MRHYGFLDHLLIAADQLLANLDSPASASPARPNPAQTTSNADLSPKERRHSAGLMRINHAGEVAAQALYRGQALTTQNQQAREMLLHSAKEENDHLAWCRQRLRELDTHPSRLDFLWFSGSWLLGMAAGLSGQRYGLGFIMETERQVAEHLHSHLQSLPESDLRSREIILQMKIDEEQHAETAAVQGALELPHMAKGLMRRTAKIMTRLAYWT